MRTLSTIAISAGCLIGLTAGAALAQSPSSGVVLDGTLRPENAGLDLGGPDVQVPAELGLQRGGNLFHSFERFNVATGGSVTFQDNLPGGGQSSIARILSRVTGGAASHIDGLIRSEIAGASLYLINPSGIVFGAGASLDIDGAFYGSTAHRILLGQSGSFLSVDPGTDSPVTADPPTAFGFLPASQLPAGLDPTPARIEVDASSLAVANGQRLGLVAGDLDVRALPETGSLPVTASEAVLAAPGGAIDLVAVASAGDVLLPAPGGDPLARLELDGFSALGDLTLRGDGPPATRLRRVATTDGDPAGTTSLQGRNLSLDQGALIESSNLAANDAAAVGIDIDLTGDLTMTGGSTLATSTLGSGRGGGIEIRAREIGLDHDDPAGIAPLIIATTVASGAGGDVHLSAESVILEQSVVATQTSFGSGAAGNIRIEADSIDLIGNGSVIDSRSYGGSTGSSGSIEIEADRLTIDGQGGFAAVQTDFGVLPEQPGPFGSTDIDYSLLPPGAELVQGNAGPIDIDARSVEVLDGGAISTTVRWGAGDSGDISIRNAEVIRIEGASSRLSTFMPNIIEAEGRFANPSGLGGDIDLQADSIVMRDRASVNTNSQSRASAGSISLAADEILIDRSQVFFGSSGFGEGGSLSLVADELTIQDTTTFFGVSGITGFTSPGSSGDSQVDIRADRIAVSGGAAIAVNGAPNAGEILIEAGRIDLFDGGRIDAESFSAPGVPGQDGGGRIEVRADQLSIRSGAVITAKGVSGGAGGEVVIDVDELTMNGGAIEARADLDLDGGTIDITASRLVRLDDGDLSASVEDGQGGNVTIQGGDAVYIGSGSTVTARATGGDGGRIDVTADAIVIVDGAELNADSDRGADGVVDIDSLDRSLSPVLDGLNVRFQGERVALRSRCGSALDAESGLEIAPYERPVSTTSGLFLADGFELLPSQLGVERTFALASFDLPESQLAAVSAAREAGATLPTDPAVRSILSQPGEVEDGSRALRTLSSHIEQISSRGSPLDVATAYRARARIYSRFEDHGAARADLRQAHGIARSAGSPHLAAVLALEAARTALDDADDEATARWLSRAAADAENDGRAATLAQVESSRGRFLIELGRPEDAKAALERARAAIEPLPRSADRALLSVHVALSAKQLAPDAADANPLLGVHADLVSAVGTAREAGDDRAIAFAIGNLAELYLEQGRYAEALELTRAAQAAAERSAAPADAYRWSWQAGRALWGLGRAVDAVDAYERALTQLYATRAYGSISALGSREEPEDQQIYRALLAAYFESADRIEDEDASRRLLLRALRRVEELRRAELRGYYRDECVAERAARRTPVATIDPDAAVLYPIILEDRVELLLEHHGTLERHSVPIPKTELMSQVGLLRRHLEAPVTRRYLRGSKRLYDALIGPVESLLAEHEIATLVVVPDGVLRTIPFAALHDGERFLVERVAVVVAPGLDLVDPQPMAVGQESILLAGVSESVQGFAPIGGVAEELTQIKRLHGGEIWMNDAFSSARIEQAFDEAPPGVVHIASHGQFTGDPATSFLLTYDGRLSMDDLERFVSRSKYADEPVEMLVLSACETAAGDEAAALGLAGVAVRAGARSALGSLWQIDDAATRELIVRFYTELGREGRSRAEALQAAQISLLKGRRYAHPAYWSPFLLISSWL